MAKKRPPIKDQMIVALQLALEEIHRPGTCQAAGMNITQIIVAVVEEATKGDPNGDRVGLLVREQIALRSVSGAPQ